MVLTKKQNKLFLGSILKKENNSFYTFVFKKMQFFHFTKEKKISNSK